ncbi:MAG: proline dehydrogenase family protein, partial [Chloroflexota bacterium]
YFSKADWMRHLMMGWKIARRVALRFVAGESLEDAIVAIQRLNSKSMIATIDQLGEDTNTAAEARKTAEDILKILDVIESSGVRSSVSIKLTQIGLKLDEDLCGEILAKILSHAQQLNNFVRIDMEDSDCVDCTMRLYWKMREEFGFKNVGMVIQSYLYRSDQDTQSLLSGETCIRMVKGAYKEPPEIAYPKKKDVDKAFDRLVKMILEKAQSDSSPAISPDGKWPPITAVATHDLKRIEYAIAVANQLGVPKEKLEFQMLYGIRRDIQEDLVAQGYPVRIYVPFGPQWYPFFMRRLAERPANLWFFVTSLFSR